jgi:ribokinase
VLNPAPARELSDELLALVDYPNETEAEKLTGIRVESDEDAAKAADAACQALVPDDHPRQPRRLAQCRRRKPPIPGFVAIDTIAAGDTFNGALVTALLEGTDLPEAIRFAHAAAAIAVTRKGAQPSVPWRTEIDEFLAQQG